MKKNTFRFARAVKRTAGILSLVTMLFAAPLTSFADSLPGTVLSGRAAGPGATGWAAQSDGSWRYYLKGSALSGTWAEIDGRWYLFDANGTMLTGWQNVNEKEYYLAEAGDASHPAGSMYASEETPDGWKVNENGEKQPKQQEGYAGIVRPNPYGYTCVEVSIPEQMVYVYVGNDLVLASACVTGRPGGRSTATGHFRINSKERNRYLQGYNSNGTRYKSWVNYWMPFYRGQGLHDASWRSAFGGDIYTYGGSHGCVNLPPSVAAELYSIAYVGMPVIVHQ